MVTACFRGPSSLCESLRKLRLWLVLSPREGWDLWDGSCYGGLILPEVSCPCYHLCRSWQAWLSGSHVLVFCVPVLILSSAFLHLEQSSAEQAPDLIFEADIDFMFAAEELRAYAVPSLCESKELTTDHPNCVLLQRWLRSFLHHILKQIPWWSRSCLSPLQPSLCMWLKNPLLFTGQIHVVFAQLRDTVVCSALETYFALQCDLVDLWEGDLAECGERCL